MNLPVAFIGFIVAGLCVLSVLYIVDRSLTGNQQVALRYAGVALMVGIFFGALHQIDDRTRTVDVTKAMIAITAAGCVFYEQHRVGMRRPVAERWKRFVGITLALCAIVAYFDGFKFGYPKYYHRWDQYHYYMGAKYFHEMGYDGLYKCGVIAQDELGVVSYNSELDIGSGRNKIDMSAEVHHGDKKIRNLGGDNLLIPVTEILEHPEECKSHFSPERWTEYKADVAFFRIGSDKTYWQDMQGDHGYNPPPVWTVGGWAFASLAPAGKVFTLPAIGKVVYLQILAMLDIAYLAGMFVAIFWAFGWRVFAVSAIFWGCQASAPALWTQGAFLRQDWLFWLVLAACAARKKWFALSGASMVYAGLLRIFPGLAVIGWLVIAGRHLIRHKTLSRPMWKTLAGGTLAAALLIPLSLRVAGKDSYQQFYKHTLEIHDRTPLTNHMGLRVLVSQKLPFEIPFVGIGTGTQSGRMKYTKDDKLRDPFEVWMRMRNERYDKLKPVAYGITALLFVYFVFVARRIKSLWIAQCLAQIFIILMSQLTSYYYSFMILLGPLTRVKRQLEVPLFGLAALSQGVFIFFYWNDDKYWVLTAVSLIFCLGTLCLFMPHADREKIAGMLGRRGPDGGSARKPAPEGEAESTES